MKQQIIEMGRPKKRKVGRPASKHPVKAKTYTFYTADIDHMLNLGFQPKIVFKKGIEALTKKYGLDELTIDKYVKVLETKQEKLIAILGTLGEKS